MAEVKNSFIKSKMNQDLDDRLIPNGEYREAFNVSINKSIGENVGTLQTVLGNESIIDFFNEINKPSLEVIGILPDDVNNTIYAFLTNNIIDPYVPTGAVGNNQTYPNFQDTATSGGPITLDNAGTGYSASNATGETLALTGSGEGMIVSFTETGGIIDNVTIVRFGSGYAIGDTIRIVGGNNDAVISVDTILPSWGAVVSFDIQSLTTKIIAQGTWLNFSTLYPITGVNILEDLLFFTDNRNQPRKVNVTYNANYYTTEDQLSVAKYYPFESIQLYQPSELTSAIIVTDTTSSSVNNSTTIPLTTGSASILVSQGVTGTEVGQNVFVTDVTNLPTSIEVNTPQTLTSGATLNFTSAETTMQDAISEDLGPFATATVRTGSGGTNTFEVSQSSFLGATPIIGQTIFVETLSGSFTDLGVTVTNFTSGVGVFVITASAVITPSVVLGDVVKFAIENPYYDSDFAANANANFLQDKFVRFSYRFKFDDGEYSLIAPFTQPCFIPGQDGYFLTQQVGVEQSSDEEKTFTSTEVAFMENKVNKILLNIPLPFAANDLGSSLKVSEIDILYKESDKVAIKVVDTIPLVDNVSGDSEYYQYEYGSKAPFKTLPEGESIRVFDKVPVKALSQEIASNRVIYGNYQDKHTPPKFLDYILAATEKSQFFASEYESTNKTSIVEYPNATLKQNRSYEVGVVLADRFGRQSTPIFSKTDLAGSPSFLSSTIFSDYRTKFDLPGNLWDFDGNSLKIQFNKTINGSYAGSPGLYNGDPDSQDYNPLGWYSYKIVVKQTQQEYYNAYIPTAMAAYPLDPSKELGITSHVILINDNINKIPRDLTEVGPAQREFRSSVRIFGRVTNYLLEPALTALDTNVQFYPEKISDISTNIATIKDLFDYKNFPTSTATDYLFYNFEFDNAATDEVADSSSLVARISTQKQFGAEVPSTGTYSNGPFLNVYEIEPVESLLDIYWETSTSGTINDLNSAINAGGGPNSFDRIIEWNWYLREDNDGSINPVSFFRPVKLDGTQFPTPGSTTAEILEIRDGAGNLTNVNNIKYYDVDNPSNGIFNIQNNGNGTFNITLNAPAGDVGLVYNFVDENQSPVIDPNQYNITLKFDHPLAEETVITQEGGLCRLNNALPVLQSSCSPLSPIGPSFKTISPIKTFRAENGSSTNSLDQLGLRYEITQVEDITDTLNPVDVTDLGYFTISDDLQTDGDIDGKLYFTEETVRPATYAVTVKVYDFEGVDPGTAGTCVLTVPFVELQTGTITGDISIQYSNWADSPIIVDYPNPNEGSGIISISGSDRNYRIKLVLDGTSQPLEDAGADATLSIYPSAAGAIGTPDVVTLNAPPVPISGPTLPIYSTNITKPQGDWYYEITIVSNPQNNGLPLQNVTSTCTIEEV